MTILYFFVVLLGLRITPLRITRFLLSVFVFLIHISSIAQYPASGEVISEINKRFAFFFKESFTRFAVPMFFILSGIAFFNNYDNSKYIKKIKSRIFTLVIPYILWNVIWMIFAVVCSHSFISNFYIGREIFELSFLNILKGIFFYKANGPFWFVFDLIIFSIAAPLINLIVRNKYIGIFSIVLLSALSLFGIQLPASVFFSSNSIIFYLIGAVVGKHFFAFVLKRSSKKIRCLSIVYLVTYIIIRNIFPQPFYSDRPFWDIVIFTLCSFALWNITDIFIDKLKPNIVYSRSFAVYALHSNVASIIAKLLTLCLPRNEWLAIPNFILTFVLGLIVINLVCDVLEKYVPKLYSVLMGKRIRRNSL